MPGIVAVFSPGPPDPWVADIRGMTDLLIHQPDSATGTWCDREAGIFVGWACHPGSWCDGMPFANEKKDKLLFLFGEAFLERSVLDGLKGRNHQFTRTNASALVHLYEEEGDSFVSRLNGIFCGILVDRTLGKTLIFNDRYGVQRLFWHQDRDALIFSSEAKAILRQRPECRSLEPRGLGEFLALDAVLDDRTLFPGVGLLPGGSLWMKEGPRDAVRGRYFNPAPLEEQTLLEGRFFADRLAETLARVLPSYFSASQRIGLSLTGGLDSRILLACCATRPRDLASYTFGSMFRENSDVRVAREIAAACSLEHHLLPLDSGFLEDFPALARETVLLTDGSCDVTGAAELYVNRKARAIAPVRLSGDFGSEVLRGVRYLKPSGLSPRPFSAELREGMARAAGHLAATTPAHPLTATLFREAPWHAGGRIALQQGILTARFPFLDNQLVDLVYRAPDEVRRSKEVSWGLIRNGNPALAAFPTDRAGAPGQGSALRLLRRLGPEASFKAEYLFDYGMPDWLARAERAAPGLHPERWFLGRHKFYHFRTWYRHQLSGHLREVLTDPAVLDSGLFDRGCLAEAVAGHTAGRVNRTRELTKALTLALLHHHLLKGWTAPPSPLPTPCLRS